MKDSVRVDPVIDGNIESLSSENKDHTQEKSISLSDEENKVTFKPI